VARTPDRQHYRQFRNSASPLFDAQGSTAPKCCCSAAGSATQQEAPPCSNSAARNNSGPCLQQACRWLPHMPATSDNRQPASGGINGPIQTGHRGVPRFEANAGGQGQQHQPANTSTTAFQPSTGPITTARSPVKRRGEAPNSQQVLAVVHHHDSATSARAIKVTTLLAGSPPGQHPPPTRNQPHGPRGSSPRPRRPALRPAGVITLNWPITAERRPAADGGARAGISAGCSSRPMPEHESPPRAKHDERAPCQPGETARGTAAASHNPSQGQSGTAV